MWWPGMAVTFPAAGRGAGYSSMWSRGKYDMRLFMAINTVRGPHMLAMALGRSPTTTQTLPSEW